MKQEAIDILMKKIDRKCKLPKHWYEFVEKNSIHHNYIIKDTVNKTGYCTYCHQTFYEKGIRIGEYKVCPNCNKEYYVLNPNRYIKDFKDSILLLQRMDKQIIIRVFEINSFYNRKTKLMEKDVQEYCRIIPGKGKFISEAVYFYMYSMYIDHASCNDSWRRYNGIRFFSDYPAYPYNERKLLKGTKMEYAPIKEFVRAFYPYNFVDAVELAGNESFELLWNLKLYKLCFRANKFNKKGSFYKRFGIPKNYLKFMQDNDLDYTELRVLKLIKEQDINLIRELSNVSYNDVKFLYKNKILKEFMQNTNHIYPSDIIKLKELQEFIPLYKLKDYPKGIKHLDIYLDYFKMAQKLALNYKSKKDLFPRNLISRHDKMQRKIKIEDDLKTHFGAYLRYLELSKYIYDDEKYIIFPAPSIDDLKDEGRQQGNCVGSMYVEPYIKNETEIFFIRKLDDICKSFITLEFKNGVVKQKELAEHSKDFTEEQENFIYNWVMYREFVDKREKYQVQPRKVVKYDLEKLVA